MAAAAPAYNGKIYKHKYKYKYICRVYAGFMQGICKVYAGYIYAGYGTAEIV